MTNDSKVEQFAPPPLEPGETLVCQVAFQDGKAFAAPIGSPRDSWEAWHRIDSLEDLAALCGVEWTTR